MQAITQAIAQVAVEATKAAAQAKAVAMYESNTGARSKPTSLGPKLGTLTFQQPTFSWSSGDKYTIFRTLG